MGKVFSVRNADEDKDLEEQAGRNGGRRRHFGRIVWVSVFLFSLGMSALNYRPASHTYQPRQMSQPNISRALPAIVLADEDRVLSASLSAARPNTKFAGSLSLNTSETPRNLPSSVPTAAPTSRDHDGKDSETKQKDENTNFAFQDEDMVVFQRHQCFPMEDICIPSGGNWFYQNNHVDQRDSPNQPNFIFEPGFNGKLQKLGLPSQTQVNRTSSNTAQDNQVCPFSPVPNHIIVTGSFTQMIMMIADIAPMPIFSRILGPNRSAGTASRASPVTPPSPEGSGQRSVIGNKPMAAVAKPVPHIQAVRRRAQCPTVWCVRSAQPHMPSGTRKIRDARPSVCIRMSETIAPGVPIRLRTGWFEE